MPPSLQDLSAKVDTLTAQVDDEEKKHKDAMEMKDKEHKDAMEDMDKKNHDAMEDEHKKTEDAGTAMEDEKEKHDAILKAVLKAMEEPDKEKREALIKAAMIEHKDDEHTETSMHKGMHKSMHEDDEKMKSMKAQLEYQDKIIRKPKLQILEAAYLNVGTEKSKVEEYKADWNKMSLPQLDAAIEQAQPIIELSGRVIETTPTPVGLGQGMSEFRGSAKTGVEEYSAKVDKMSVEELFN